MAKKKIEKEVIGCIFCGKKRGNTNNQINYICATCRRAHSQSVKRYEDSKKETEKNTITFPGSPFHNAYKV